LGFKKPVLRSQWGDAPQEFQEISMKCSLASIIGVCVYLGIPGACGAQPSVKDVGSYKLIKEIRASEAKGIVKMLCSPDGKLLLSVDDKSVVKIWDLSNGKLARELDYRGDIYDIAFSRDGKQLLLCDNRSIKSWSIQPHTALAGVDLEKWPGEIRHVQFSADQKWLATASPDGAVGVWDVATGKRVAQFQHPEFDYTWMVAFSPDGSKLAVAGRVADEGFHYIVVWDVVKNKRVGRCGRTAGMVTGLVFHPSGKYFVTGDGGTSLRVWNVEKEAMVSQHEEHHTHITALGFSADGKYLVSLSAEAARFWTVNAETGCLKQVAVSGHDYGSAVLSADGSKTYLGSRRDGSISIYESPFPPSKSPKQD
jgi:WD40 repeat protein